MIIAEWSGFDNVNVKALILCFIVVGYFFIKGILWLRDPEYRSRGIWTLVVIVVPTLLASATLFARLL